MLGLWKTMFSFCILISRASYLVVKCSPLKMVRHANSTRVADLKIKPVSLVIELFVVLQHGRRAKLCLARLTQTKGAASSFRKVADVIEDVFRTRGMLVEDEAKKSEMLEVFGI